RYLLDPPSFPTRRSSDLDVTVTFHGRKAGLVVAPGRFHAGNVHVVDIGLEAMETEHRLVCIDLLRTVPRRREGDNKYTAGHVLRSEEHTSELQSPDHLVC